MDDRELSDRLAKIEAYLIEAIKLIAFDNYEPAFLNSIAPETHVEHNEQLPETEPDVDPQDIELTGPVHFTQQAQSADTTVPTGSTRPAAPTRKHATLKLEND